MNATSSLYHIVTLGEIRMSNYEQVPWYIKKEKEKKNKSNNTNLP